MQKNFFQLIIFSLIPLTTYSAEKRTDGPPGSEYGDFSNWDSAYQIGLQFGAMMDSNNDETSLSLGVDFDYRPTDLFGIRASYSQSVQNPNHALILFTPLIHSDFSNFNWYVNFGPGLAFVERADVDLKFAIAVGIGGDFMFNEKFGLGLLWNYAAIFDTFDLHNVGARISYHF